ncbi:MAG: peptide deformylase [Anaerolineaceae bacterium]|jgi:peptide deformylase|nr:peptide deformylase [Anaerolineaceae bacterium]MDD4042390.1 peptide deformylase [Anaerolineaceae bacterium]MDD4579027.1 peptide deformylase [Anaerolineaceae bacterium]
MALKEILTFPDPFLRLKAKPVKKFDKELQTLIDDMFETMRAEPGVGLAAPQIGESLQLVVIEYAEEPEDENAPEPKPKRYVLVNPEIVERSDEMVEGMEGCLSVPGFIGKVDRHEKITVKALTRHGKPQRVKAEGWMARIIQHELDHLDGVLYIDRASEMYEPVPEDADEFTE